MDETNQTDPKAGKLPWYFKNGLMVVAFLCVGPLMLPLVWIHPRMTATQKIIWTAVIAALSYFLVVSTVASMKKIGEYYQQLKAAMP